MYSKELYLEEIEKMEYSKNAELEKQLLFLFDVYEGNSECETIKEEVYKTLEMIFDNGFSSEIMLPISFIQSQIGTVLFDLLYNHQEQEYTVKEIVELLNCIGKYSRQYVSRILSEERQAGIINGTNKHGMWFYRHSDVMAFVQRRKEKTRK